MKLDEFVDRLYAMGGVEQEKKKSKRLNESFVRQWFPKNADYFLNDLENVLNIVPIDSRHDEIEDEDQVLYEFSGTKDDFQHAVDYFGYFENLDYQKKYLDDELEYSDDISKLTYNESLNEARNQENDEVNAILRKWANSDRNRISKRDQKVLDDAGISLETAKYDAPRKYAVHKNHKDDRVPHAFYKNDIKRAHPDHDLANDLATTGRHWSNRDRYNKNKDPRFPWRDAEYRSETPEESAALRPYSDEYKKLKHGVEFSKGYPYWHAAEEKKLDAFRADMQAKKNESVTLNESKEGLKDWFWSMIEDGELDTETATGILLTYISDEDLLDAIDETKEYLES